LQFFSWVEFFKLKKCNVSVSKISVANFLFLNSKTVETDILLLLTSTIAQISDSGIKFSNENGYRSDLPDCFLMTTICR